MLYRLLALFHWRPRALAVKRALSCVNDAKRVVDVGCGPAWLARVARSCDLDYLGVDPSVRRAKGIERGQVEPGDAESVIGQLHRLDIVVLNGVAHHLPNQTLAALLNAAEACKALVICDHRSEPQNHSVCRTLQRLDRGQYIRPRSFFETLAGWTLIRMEPFEICVLGLPVWSYFTAIYQPTGAPRD
ncbi:MAG: class I SAM-dependent methyltransferase [Phycisphaerales bacterium]|nr:class I SAM-dependent methyltransferase [Phycisphaerales bacterium]